MRGWGAFHVREIASAAMSIDKTNSTENQPLQSLDEWEDFLKGRYSEPGKTAAECAENRKPAVGYDPEKKQTEFRNYEADARPTVREFYRLNHTHQTYDFVQAKHRQYLGLNRMQMGVWEAAEYLNQLVDDSDPDTDMSQLEHLLQTAEQLRRDGKPRWMILTGFVHDLGKILCLWGEPQWAVVGDTFPTGCAYSRKIVFPDFFEANPDSRDPRFQSRNGVYEEGCGLDRVNLSWGHDEYIYNVCKDYLPIEGLYMLRYHSFYPWHREEEYGHLCNDADRRLLASVREFNPYDLYTKSHSKPDAVALRLYYEDLIREYFPDKIRW
jgi:inositol oxygenase